MYTNIKFLLFGVLIFSLSSCKSESDLEKEISEIKIEFNIERFDRLLANATENDLSSLKEDYPFMFSERIHDSVWLNQINDSLQQELFKEVNTKFKDTDKLELEIEDLFKHFKYYYKTFSPPRTIAVTSYVDYRNKVIVTDTIALIALDTYLGSDHKFYVDIYKYISQHLKPEMIVSDLAAAYAETKIPQIKRRTLLDEMIYFGKILYFKDVMLPDKSDEEKIGYTTDQLNWAIENESQMWRYFIERNLLFATDSKLVPRFISAAPFTKFNLELDNESPGWLGQYIGWQIVRAYMENNETKLTDLMIMNAEEIFNKSKFKPRK